MAKEDNRLAPSGHLTAAAHRPNMRLDAKPVPALRLTVPDSTGLDTLFPNCAGPQYGVGYPSLTTGLAGFPTTIVSDGMSFVTTAPAPTTHLSPIAIPGEMITPPPIQQSSPIDIGLANSGRHHLENES